MTSQEIHSLILPLLRDGDTSSLVPLWEIAYQLAKQVEQQEELIRLMRIQITRNTGLADPQPVKRDADSQQDRGASYGNRFQLADPQPVKRDAASEPGDERLVSAAIARVEEWAKILPVSLIRADVRAIQIGLDGSLVGTVMPTHFNAWFDGLTAGLSQRSEPADSATEARTQTNAPGDRCNQCGQIFTCHECGAPLPETCENCGKSIQHSQLAGPATEATSQPKEKHPTDCECPTCRFHRPL